jgi:NAD-dependent SIR2 family protein deacetylase
MIASEPTTESRIGFVCQYCEAQIYSLEVDKGNLSNYSRQTLSDKLKKCPKCGSQMSFEAFLRKVG